MHHMLETDVLFGKKSAKRKQASADVEQRVLTGEFTAARRLKAAPQSQLFNQYLLLKMK